MCVWISLVMSHRTPVRMTLVERYDTQQNRTDTEHLTIINPKIKILCSLFGSAVAQTHTNVNSTQISTVLR
jgi:hypothetical protein